jgi:hypothetical protein
VVLPSPVQLTQQIDVSTILECRLHVRLEIVRDRLEGERQRQRERRGTERETQSVSDEARETKSSTSLCALYNLSDQLVFCVHIL